VGALWPGGPLELPAVFVIDHNRYWLESIPTPRLLHLLSRGRWWELVPNALPDWQREELVSRLYDKLDPLHMVHLWKASTDLLAGLAGTVPPDGGHGYTPACRIAAMMVHNWMAVDGWAATHGVDLLNAPLHRVIAVGYRMLMEGCRDEKDLQMMESRVWQAPESMPESVPRWTADQEAMSGMAALTEMMPGGMSGALTAEPSWSS
jgi:hypothetical protein